MCVCVHCCWAWPVSFGWLLLCYQPWDLQQCHRNITVQHFSLKGCVRLPSCRWCLIALCFSLSSVSLVLCYATSPVVWWTNSNKQGERKGKRERGGEEGLQAAAHSWSQMIHSFKLFCEILHLDVFQIAVKMKDMISQHLGIKTAHASCSLHLSYTSGIFTLKLYEM